MDFLRDETGQDLTEYALLLAFIVIASCALLAVNFNSVAGVWVAGNQVIGVGNSLAQAGTS
jgi:Flp pilus assembly pilin Flp